MKRRFKIGVIGGGHMGEALILAILRKKLFPSRGIAVSEPDPRRRRQLRRHHVTLLPSNSELVRASPIVLLAVKPQHMKSVLGEIAPAIRKDHLVITIAAGLDTRFYETLLPPQTRLIRAMPNSPAAIGEGAAALFANPAARPLDRRLALKIFQAAGEAVFLPREDWLDLVTALSGSGPAFVYEFARALISAGEAMGLPATIGRPLVLKTIIGAGRLLEQSRDSIPSLIAKVTSKGGTTEAGLEYLRSRGFGALIAETIREATARARQLRGG